MNTSSLNTSIAGLLATAITPQVNSSSSITTPTVNMSGSMTSPGLGNASNLNTTTASVYPTESPEQVVRDFWIGLGFAISSNVFIGMSYILKKLGLLNSAKKQSTRAASGGYYYLKEWLWWLGMTMMIVGEVMNFAAYIFAPATLVTPLGALSVISAAVMSSYFLKERLNLLGKVGCLLCLMGSTVMVINAPKSQEIHSMEELLQKCIEPGIIVLCLILLIIALVTIFVVVPKYGEKHVVVYLVICSIFGSFTVVGCKGVGVAIKETSLGYNEFTNWLTWVMVAIILGSVLVELNFLNKSLDTFNTAIVTPTYYVIFTSIVILVSLVLFQEFGKMTPENITGNMCGFLTIVCGIFLLNAFKDMNVTLKNLPKAQKRLPSHSSQNGDVVINVGHDDHHLLEDNENHSQDEDQSIDIIGSEYLDDPKPYTDVFPEKDGKLEFNPVT